MNTVDDIKERLSIEEVVGQYVSLKAAGSNLKGKCPFHAEKTPSFVVSPMRQTYHCFGCGVGGDIFTFTQEIEGLDFRGALNLLADKAGVVVTFEKGVEKNDSEILLSLLESITEFYHQNLKKNKIALEYLVTRGISLDTSTAFRIGLAPDSWRGAYEHLRKEGFDEKHIEEAGITKKGDKGPYDRFRSRIMFPITDSIGRVVAFSGRIVQLNTPSTKLEHEPAKYINSPETTLYHKSKILYGYDRARQAIRKTNCAILVEGQMDLVMTHQAGYSNTVALSGTALTSEHLTLLGRMSHNLVIALDADTAGIRSSGKSAKAALRDGFDVKIAALPDGDDPADIISRGALGEWKKTIRNAQHVVDFLLSYYRIHTKDERTFKQLVAKEVLPYILEIESEIDKSHFIQRVAAQLLVTEEIIRQELSKIKREVENVGTVPDSPKIPVEEISGADDELVLLYLWQTKLEKPFVDVKRLEEQIEAVLSPLGFSAAKERLAQNSSAAFTFELLYSDKESMKKATNELLDRVARRHIKTEIEKTGASLRKAESEKDTAAIKKFEKEYQQLIGKRIQLEKQL